MSEEQKKRTSRIAIASLICGCLHIGLICGALFFTSPLPINLGWIGVLYPYLIALFGLVAFILGIIALITIFLNKSILRGRGLAIVGILLPSISLMLSLTIFTTSISHTSEKAIAAEMENILGALRASQLRYYKENGKFTTNTADLDLQLLPSYYYTISLPNSVYDGDETIVATATRTNEINKGYGAYTISISAKGDVSCTGGKKCPRRCTRDRTPNPEK